MQLFAFSTLILLSLQIWWWSLATLIICIFGVVFVRSFLQCFRTTVFFLFCIFLRLAKRGQLNEEFRADYGGCIIVEMNEDIQNLHVYFQFKHLLLMLTSLQWRHNECDGVSNYRRFDCLLKHFLRRSSKKTSKLRVIYLCEGSSPVIGGFLSRKASDAEKVSIEDVIIYYAYIKTHLATR